MKLKDWLKSKGMTQAAFAKQIGVDQSTISRLIRGRGNRQMRKLDLDLAAKIEAETDGAVTAKDFMPRPDCTDDVPPVGGCRAAA